MYSSMEDVAQDLETEPTEIEEQVCSITLHTENPYSNCFLDGLDV